MKIDKFKVRTLSSPTNGVTFHAADKLRIEEAAVALAQLPVDLITVMRLSLAREILHLDELADWTEGEAEQIRKVRQESAMVAYEATYEANAAARFLAAQKEKKS